MTYYVYQEIGNGQMQLVGESPTIEGANQLASQTPNAGVISEEQLAQYTNQQQPQQKRGMGYGASPLTYAQRNPEAVRGGRPRTIPQASQHGFAPSIPNQRHHQAPFYNMSTNNMPRAKIKVIGLGGIREY